MTRPPGLFFFFFFFFSETKVERKRCTNSKMHRGGWGLGIRLQNADLRREAWMVKPLSAGCVNTVVACWILITSDYVSQVPQRKLTRTRTRNRKLTLCGLRRQYLNVEVSSHFVNSHFVNSHFVNSHLVNFPLCQFPLCQFPFGQCWQSGNWRNGNWQSGKLTKWEDLPLYILITTVIDQWIF